MGWLNLVCDPLVKTKLREMTAKLEEIFIPYRSMQSITYNHFYTDTVRKTKNQRNRAEITNQLKRAAPGGILDPAAESFAVQVSPAVLFNHLTAKTEEDIDRYACTEILD